MFLERSGGHWGSEGLRKLIFGWSRTPFSLLLGADVTAGATADGHRVVVSGGYYLDNADPCDPMYALDPQAGISDPEQRSLVVGGEAALWAESMDLSNLGSRAWPRAAAIAERLWGGDGYGR